MGTRVYIGRLSHSAREKDVERFFKGYGKVREIVLKEGYGFVVSYTMLCVCVPELCRERNLFYWFMIQMID